MQVTAVFITDNCASLVPNASLHIVRVEHTLRVVEVGHEEEDEERYEAKLHNLFPLLIPEALKDGID